MLNSYSTPYGVRSSSAICIVINCCCYHCPRTLHSSQNPTSNLNLQKPTKQNATNVPHPNNRRRPNWPNNLPLPLPPIHPHPASPPRKTPLHLHIPESSQPKRPYDRVFPFARLARGYTWCIRATGDSLADRLVYEFGTGWKWEREGGVYEGCVGWVCV